MFMHSKQYFRRRYFPPGFDEWCRTIVARGNLPSVTLDDFQKNNGELSASELSNAFNEFITAPGKRWSAIDIVYPSGVHQYSFNFPFRNRPPATKEEVNEDSTDIWVLLANGYLPEFSLSGAVVHDIIISLSIVPLAKGLSLSNCTIGKLTIYGPSMNVELRNCWIGCLSIASGCLKNLTVNGGGIASIDCPPSDGPNPFVGSVQFSNVFFPTSKMHTALFETSQAYRSMHSHLIKLDNVLTANQVRSLQLHSERGQEKGAVAKFVNWFYGTFANYGTSPGRPLMVLVFLYAVTAALTYHYDGGKLTLPAEAYIGAYSVYLDGNGGWLTRSLILPAQSILNPFSMFFDVRRYVVPDTWQMGVWLTVQGILSDLMLLLSGISMRRRFKAG